MTNRLSTKGADASFMTNSPKTKGADGTFTYYHQWIPTPPMLKVKLERGQKGAFAWEITFEGADSADVLARIRDVNNQLERKYAQPEEQRESNA